MEDETNKCQCQCQCQKESVQQDIKATNNVTQVWWDFLQETTFHGCKNIEDRRRSVVYRVLWTLIVLGMLSGLLHTLFQSYVGYYEYRVNSKSRIDVNREMPFPAITVCSATPVNIAGKNVSQTLIDYFAKLTSLWELIPLNWSDPNLDHFTMKYVNDELSIPYLTSKRWRGSGNMTFNPVDTFKGKCYLANNDTSHTAMATVEGRTGGLELTLHIEEDGVIMQDDMTYGAMIFIHDPREHARTKESGIMVAPGNSFYINLKPTKYKFLPAPYKSYGNSYCVETDYKYSYQACASHWLSSQAAIKCNCTTGVEPPEIVESSPSCTLRQFANCYLGAHHTFSQQTLNENFTVCPKPCSFTRYETSVSFSKFPSAAAAEKFVELYKIYGYPHADQDFVRRNALQVTIYFDRFFMEHVVYVPEVTVNGILSSLGGQMGFFLGASLITVAELGEALVRLFCTLGKKITGTGNKTNVNAHHNVAANHNS